MTRDDEPTQPLPAADRPDADATPDAPTERLVAPHVPVAEVDTAQLSSIAAEPQPDRGRGGKRLLVVGLAAVAAAIIAVAALTGLQRMGDPAPLTSSSPPAAPSPSAPEEDAGDEEPAPPPPPAPEEPEPEPEPEPTAEPTVEPTVEPTPAPTP